jgi:dTDP-4-dehydrorhamnose reductase
MRIGITGASGMLGAVFVTYLSKLHKIFATSRNKGAEGENIEWSCFDLTNTVMLNKWLKNIKPDVIIHCAAIVNVDFCEDNVKLATKLHIETTKVMTNYLNSNGGRLIYISTDSVFDGEKQGAYSETDSVNPLNIYAKTKLMGELPVLSMDSGLVLRVNIIGWTQKNRASFAEWLLKGLIDGTPLNLFHDVCFSPLHVDDLSLIIGGIINKPIFGLYNCASDNGISKYDFGNKMADIFHLSNSNINRVSVDNMVLKANRPKNMVLDTSKIKLDLKCSLPIAEDSIKLMKCQYDKNRNLIN